MANINIPLVVYENLIHLCKYRGANVTNRVARDAFVSTMEIQHYVSINAERAANDIRSAAHLLIIQFSQHRHIDASSQKFNTFLERQIRARPADGIEYNIILISSTAVSPAISRSIITTREAGIVIEHYQMSTFLIIAPEHACVPQHTIIPRADIDKLCNEMHMTINNFPCLIASGANPDPMAIWLGLRPGMIVRIDRPCETAGRETVYRRCV